MKIPVLTVQLSLAASAAEEFTQGSGTLSIQQSVEPHIRSPAVSKILSVSPSERTDEGISAFLPDAAVHVSTPVIETAFAIFLRHKSPF